MLKKKGQAATKQLMVDAVYRSLRQMMADRRFKAGQRLNVEEIARELGVSRTPVWEAVRRIEQDGILYTIPNRGVFMTDNPLERIRDMLQVRSALDRLAGELSVQRIDDRAIGQLSRCLPDQLKGIETAELALYIAADVRFHRLIVEETGNVVLKNLYQSITSHVFPTSLHLLPILPALYLTHQELITALAARDPGRVGVAIARHEEILMSHVEEQVAAEADRKEMVRLIKENRPTVGGRRK